MAVLGLDVGGTLIKATLLDDALTPVTGMTRPTPKGADPAAAVVAEVADIVETLCAKESAAAVGVVVPGIVDEDAGIARYAANLGWRDAPLRDLLAARLPLPVAFGHDVRAGGLAEARVGAARGFATAAFVPVGTGIAAALTVDGRALVAGGYAGELGHVQVGGDRRCGCGAVGCLETVAGCPAIVAAYGATASTEQIVAAAVAGEPRAVAVLGAALDGLATALATLACLVAPEVVVLGGGLFAGGEPLLSWLRTRLADRLRFQRLPELRVAALGSNAGCIGAGLLATEVAR